MIKLLTTITILVFLTGCSSKNAFSSFDLSKEQELSVSSLLSSKIKSENGEINGVVSAIYLNEIYPESYHNNEYFFVYVYLKNNKQLSNPAEFDDLELSLKLNNENAIKIKQLSNENRFSDLAFIKSDWNKYYLVAFEKQNKSKINLVLESGQFSSGQLSYQKAE